ncbi:hypothetical protein [Myceligenerans indicum]|uniref:ATP/GTP-binding protein n=1 Tax=Myceligenerans indicum TaxID=2593663 RepID=A0ABS1LER9_9MICO|nr:hypothetical protein [Myceligenerans indicum]MBL0884766.1 hypothetical protein [Myceligenerans indicum]
MRRAARLSLLMAPFLVVSFLVAASPASADPVCLDLDPRTGDCNEWSEEDEIGEEADEDGETVTPDTEVNGGVACFFAEITNPQPPPYESFWDGHRDADRNPIGIALNCTYDPENRGLRWRYWAAEPPGGANAPDPVELARQAVGQLGIEPPQIGIVPHEKTTGAVGTVGVFVWGWTANPGPSTLGPLTAEAGEGPFTVSVVAEVDRLVWDWGDGIGTECAPPGTPFQEGFGFRASPDCGHDGYTSQGDKQVSLTAVWRIEWTAADATFGEFEHEVAATAPAEVRIGEVQVLRR